MTATLDPQVSFELEQLSRANSHGADQNVVAAIGELMHVVENAVSVLQHARFQHFSHPACSLDGPVTELVRSAQESIRQIRAQVAGYRFRRAQTPGCPFGSTLGNPYESTAVLGVSEFERCNELIAMSIRLTEAAARIWGGYELAPLTVQEASARALEWHRWAQSRCGS